MLSRPARRVGCCPRSGREACLAIGPFRSFCKKLLPCRRLAAQTRGISHCLEWSACPTAQKLQVTEVGNESSHACLQDFQVTPFPLHRYKLRRPDELRG